MSSEMRPTRQSTTNNRICSEFRARAARLGLLIAALIIGGCDSGSFGSDVDNAVALPPIAQITVIGSGPVVRSGAEVLLSAKDSDGLDSPAIDFRWNQTAGPTVELITRSKTASSFTAPNEETTLTFELIVTDTDGDMSRASQSIDVIFAPDSDEFLRLGAVSDGVQTNTNQFIVVATTQNGIEAVPGSMESVKFTVSVVHEVTYPGRDGDLHDYKNPIGTVKGEWKHSVGSKKMDPFAFNNPRFSFPIPAIDLDEINFEDQDNEPGPARNAILDLDQVDLVSAKVVVTLDVPGQPDYATVFVFGPEVHDHYMIDQESARGGSTVAKSEINVQELLDEDGQETAETASDYYKAIDPDDERLTLNDWLFENCMDAGAENFAADARARYFNNFYLGFGRDMYMKENCHELGARSFVVINYPSLEAAAKTIDPMLAVAMEWSPSKRISKFFAFAPSEDGNFKRVLSTNCDGRGQKYVPGTCAACHGGLDACRTDPGQVRVECESTQRRNRRYLRQ